MVIRIAETPPPLYRCVNCVSTAARNVACVKFVGEIRFRSSQDISYMTIAHQVQFQKGAYPTMTCSDLRLPPNSRPRCAKSLET